MPSRFMLVTAVVCLMTFATASFGQERVTSPNSKGGTPLNPKWQDVPPEFRSTLTIPEWPMPTDLRRWEKDRLEVRQTLVKLMGALPPRPDPAKVKVVSHEDRGEFFLDRNEFHNGADAIVPGYVMIPKAAAPGGGRRPC